MATATFKTLRFVSIALCLIVIASFAVFAINQAGEGSEHQQEELGSKPALASTSPGATGAGTGSEKSHEGTVHKGLTEASNAVTSPFSGLISSNSEWGSRILKLVLALLFYGFGLGFLARMVRVRL